MSAPRRSPGRADVLGQRPNLPCLAVRAEEIPAVLNIGLDTFNRYIRSEVRVVRCGTVRLYLVSELERWLEENAERVLEEGR